MRIEQAFLNKKDARKFFLAQRSTLTKEQIKVYSAQLSKLLCMSEEFKNADTVLFYYPTRNEPELFEAMTVATAAGKNIAFPISVTDTLTLDFRKVSSPDDLICGAYSISEPRTDAEKATFSKNSLCVVPALAFDKKGFRLGYGKGYYDRFLSSFPGVSVGLCFDGFLSDSLPTDDNDIAVNILITNTGVFEKK